MRDLDKMETTCLVYEVKIFICKFTKKKKASKKSSIKIL